MNPSPHHQAVVALLPGGHRKVFPSIAAAAKHFKTSPDRAAKWLDDSAIGSYRGDITCLRLQRYGAHPGAQASSRHKVRGVGSSSPAGLRVTYANGETSTFKSLAEASRELGVSPSGIKKWIANLTPRAKSTLGITSVVQLTKQVRVTFERRGISKTFGNYAAMAEWLGIPEPRMLRWAKEGVPVRVQEQYGPITLETEVS